MSVASNDMAHESDYKKALVAAERALSQAQQAASYWYVQFGNMKLLAEKHEEAWRWAEAELAVLKNAWVRCPGCDGGAPECKRCGGTGKRRWKEITSLRKKRAKA